MRLPLLSPRAFAARAAPSLVTAGAAEGSPRRLKALGYLDLAARGGDGQCAALPVKHYVCAEYN